MADQIHIKEHSDLFGISIDRGEIPIELEELDNALMSAVDETLNSVIPASSF